MQLLFATIAVFWWVAIWGLTDLLTDSWTRRQRFYLYIGMIALIVLTLWIFPDFINHL